MHMCIEIFLQQLGILGIKSSLNFLISLIQYVRFLYLRQFDKNIIPVISFIILCGELFEDNVRVDVHNSAHSYSLCRDYSGTCICSMLVDMKLSSGHPFVLSPVSLFSLLFRELSKKKLFIILVRFSYKSSLR